MPTQAVSGAPRTDSGITQATSVGIAGIPVTSSDLSGGAVPVTDKPVSGTRLAITDFIVAADTNMVLTLTEEDTGKLVEKFYLTAGAQVQVTPRGKKMLSRRGTRVMARTSVSGNIVIGLVYYGVVVPQLPIDDMEYFDLVEAIYFDGDLVSYF